MTMIFEEGCYSSQKSELKIERRCREEVLQTELLLIKILT